MESKRKTASREQRLKGRGFAKIRQFLFQSWKRRPGLSLGNLPGVCRAALGIKDTSTKTASGGSCLLAAQFQKEGKHSWWGKVSTRLSSLWMPHNEKGRACLTKDGWVAPFGKLLTSLASGGLEALLWTLCYRQHLFFPLICQLLCCETSKEVASSPPPTPFALKEWFSQGKLDIMPPLPCTSHLSSHLLPAHDTGVKGKLPRLAPTGKASITVTAMATPWEVTHTGLGHQCQKAEKLSWELLAYI